MVVLIVWCHPEEKSFNHAIAEMVVRNVKARGHVVYVHDLYRERFDAVLSAVELKRRFSFDEQVQRYSRELTDANFVVFIHPEWWNGPPALLKGWIDRVLRPGVAYEHIGPEFSRKSRAPLLTGKRALVIATTDAESMSREPRTVPAAAHAEAGATDGARRAAPRTAHDEPGAVSETPAEAGQLSVGEEPLLTRFWRQLLEFCGITDMAFELLDDMRNRDAAERREWLLQLEGRLAVMLQDAGR